MLDESVGNGLCAVPPSPRNWHISLNGKQVFPVGTNRIPFNREFRPVGWVPLRGWNGTQAVPYGTNAQEAFIQVRRNVTGHRPGAPDDTPARCAIVRGHCPPNYNFPSVSLPSVGCEIPLTLVCWWQQKGVDSMNSYITGPAIKRFREERKLTQAQLAEKIGVSDKAVSKWETGVSQS